MQYFYILQTPPSIATQKQRKKSSLPALPDWPKEFNLFCETVFRERDIAKNLQNISDIDDQFDNEFRAKNAWQHLDKEYGEYYWDVKKADCRYLDLIGIARRNYTLLIIDIPYGFDISVEHDDSVAWGDDDLRQVVQKFKRLTTAKFFRIIVMHSRQQWPFVEKVLTDELTGGCEFCIWVKKNCYNAGGARLHSQWEPFTIGFGTSDGTGRLKAHYCFKKEDNRSNVVEFLTVNTKTKSSLDDRTINEYQKPRKLLNWMIKNFSRRNDWVLDLCSGSGTGMLSALSFGRNVVGVEIDRRLVESIPSLINSLKRDITGFSEYEKALTQYKRDKPASEKIVMDTVDEDSIQVSAPLVEVEDELELENLAAQGQRQNKGAGTSGGSDTGAAQEQNDGADTSRGDATTADAPSEHGPVVLPVSTPGDKDNEGQGGTDGSDGNDGQE